MKHYLRTFESLLYDAVYILYFSFDINQDDYVDDMIGSFARASILNSILLLECGANCVIDALCLPRQYYKDIDKLPIFSKFEFFLDRMNKNQKFDRGCKEVQCIAELKDIRDSYVHPKVKQKAYEIISEDVWEANYGYTEMLKFPRDTGEWDRRHAILALKSVNDFYNMFFLDWCRLEANVVCNILLSSDKADMNAHVDCHIDVVGGLDRAAREWGIDFKFIGKQL